MPATIKQTSVTVTLLVVIVLFSAQAFAQRQNPVSIKASITPSKSKSTFRVVVEIDIEEGWHTYDELSEDNPSPTTDVDLDLPEGVKATSDWVRPVGVDYLADPSITVFEGKVKFVRLIHASGSPAEREIGVTVSYQVCNERLCLPPKKFTTAVILPPVESTGEPEAGNAKPKGFVNKHFDAPVRLMVADKPLNSMAKQMYPSPAMFDVDSDGKVELIIGDIFGSLNVYENTNEGSGDPVWASFVPLKTADDKVIKVSNW